MAGPSNFVNYNKSVNVTPLDSPMFAKFLSAQDLVDKGYAKQDTPLPEVGLKEVVPNGTWLEQKQIQAALEAKKQIIGAERIIKHGGSQAEWLDPLRVADCMRRSGGHWRYFGRRFGHRWSLDAKEALFLIECNMLTLKHDGVKMSFQKAFAVLLRDDMPLIQYKVYSSMCRLGYKVHRHVEPVGRVPRKRRSDQSPDNSPKVHRSADNVECEFDVMSLENDEMETVPVNSAAGTSQNTNGNENNDKLTNIMEEDVAVARKDVNGKMDNGMEVDGNDVKMNADDQSVEMRDEADMYNANYSADFTIDENGVIRMVEKNQMQQETYESMPSCSNEIEMTRKNKIDNYQPFVASTHSGKNPTNIYQLKHHKLRNRKTKPLNQKTIEEAFNNIPDICNQQVVTIKVPDEKLLPRNVFLNNSVYVLNIEHIKTKIQSQIASHEVPTNAQRRIGPSAEEAANTEASQYAFRRFPRFHNPNQFQFRPAWRPQLHFNYFPPFQTFLQRPHLPSFYAHRFRFHQFQTFARPEQYVECQRQYTFDNPNRRLSHSQVKLCHFQAIKTLAARVQRLSQMFRGIDTNGLYRLLAGYNSRYNERLRLTRDFEIINVSTPTEVIELDDEEEISNKNQCEENKFEKHLDAIKVLAGKLGEFADNNQCTSRHRRAISKLIKKFNKSFNADIYMNTEYNIIDRKFICLDSSSENESKKKTPKRKKKLRNPFSILKQMNKKADKGNSGEALLNEEDMEVMSPETPREILLKYFEQVWLPNNDDFGRPEVCTKNFAKTHIAETHNDELLFDFLKDRQNIYKNWLDLKMSFANNLEASSLAHENKQIDILSKDFMMDFDSKFKPIIGPDDCKDIPTVLEKLRIIKTKTYTTDEPSLRIHFDGYNRDVSDYTKNYPPPPHFRIICIDEYSAFPTGTEIAALHSKFFEDKVPIVFADVGLGSISYLRLNPSDLEVYIPSTELA